MSKLAFLFPGQGSQYVGMGRALYDADPQARELFEQAEAVTGLPLLRLCFEGPMEELTETVNLQPAVTMVNLALFNALKRAGVAPDCVAGHSLGEYSALHAAGVLTAADTLRAVQERGRVMQREAEAHPGAMAAVIGLAREQLVEMLAPLAAQGALALANFNTPEQIVISGDQHLIEAACAALKEAKVRAVPLAVSGAWHSPLMAAAGPDFAAFLATLTFSPAVCPVLLNVTGSPETDPAKIHRFMTLQLTSGVMWTAIIAHMQALGVDTYVEVGPKNVLKGLVRKCLPKDSPAAFHNVEDPAGMEKFLGEYKK